MERLSRGTCWVIWSAAGNHGTRRGVPERTMPGECERWQGLPDIIGSSGRSTLRRTKWPWRQSWTLHPEPLKATHRPSPLDQSSVDVLTLWIRQASYVPPSLFQGQVPMQVNAVGDHGHGKRQAVEGQGSRQQLEHKAEKFQGCCSHCATWGRKRADCRQRLAQQFRRTGQQAQCLSTAADSLTD